MNKDVRDVILELFDDRTHVDLWNAYQRELLANEVTKILEEFLTAGDVKSNTLKPPVTPKTPVPFESAKSLPVIPTPGGNLDNKMFKTPFPIKKKMTKGKKSIPTMDAKQKYEPIDISGEMSKEEMIKKVQNTHKTHLKKLAK